MLVAGDLDRRITIQQANETTNAYGERTRFFVEYREVWAKVSWKISKEKEESDQRVQVSNVTFYIRNLDIELNPEMRILHDDKIYYFDGIKEIDGREMFLEITTKEKE